MYKYFAQQKKVVYIVTIKVYFIEIVFSFMFNYISALIINAIGIYTH